MFELLSKIINLVLYPVSRLTDIDRIYLHAQRGCGYVRVTDCRILSQNLMSYLKLVQDIRRLWIRPNSWAPRLLRRYYCKVLFLVCLDNTPALIRQKLVSMSFCAMHFKDPGKYTTMLDSKTPKFLSKIRTRYQSRKVEEMDSISKVCRKIWSRR